MAEMWYYTTEGKQMDPVTIKELKRLVGDGTLKPTDMVWKEGMARWIRASSVKELFPDPISALDHYFTSTAQAEQQGKAPSAIMPSASASAAGPTPAKAETPAEKDDAAKKKRKPSAAEEEGDKRKPPRRRAETASSGASSVGIIVGIVIALGLLFIACGGGLAIIIWVAPLGQGKGDPINGQINYDTIIGPSGVDSRVFNFRRGVAYELTQKSEPRNADVDLFVIDVRSNQVVASDANPGPDSIVRWTPNDGGDFRVEVRNKHVAMRVTSKVMIREQAGAGPPAADKDKAGPKDQLPPLPPDVFEGTGLKDIAQIPGGQNRELKFRIRAGHMVNFRVVPDRPNVDFNLIVQREGGDNAVLAADEGPQPVAEVNFVAANTEIVRVRIVNVSKGPKTASKAKLFYNVSP